MKNLNFKFIRNIFLLVFFAAQIAYGQNAETLYEDGLHKLKRLKRVEAKLIFTKAIEKNPNLAKAYYQRGLINKHFNDIEEAFSDFKKVTYLESDFKTEAHFEIGLMKVEQRRYKESVIDFSIVLNDDSTNAKAYYLRGISNKLSNKNEVAYLDFISAIKFDTNNVDAYFQKGVVEVELIRFAEAIESFTKTISKKNNHAKAYFFRGVCYFEIGLREKFDWKKTHLTQALADFDQALKIDDKLDYAYFDRGKAKMELKDYIGAIADFKKSIDLKPGDLNARYLKAICNYHYGYEDIAYKEMVVITNMDSTFANAQYFVAQRLYETQNYKQALVEFNKLYAIEGPQPDAYVFRGYTKLELGDKIGACSDWKEAEKLNDKEAELVLKKYCK